MFVRARITILSLALLLAAPAAWSATEPAVYGSLTNFAGKGKHPKSAVSGLIIDSRASGRKFICYNYVITTNSKVKGQVSGIVERISDSGVEKLGTFGKMNVFDFSDLPIPPDNPNDPCAPEFPDEPTNFNFGIATDCLEIATQLEPNDIIRWKFNFKKGAKLKGSNAAISVFGSVIPGNALGASAADFNRVREEAAAMARLLSADR